MAERNVKLTAEELRAVLSYDAVSGDFRWISSLSPRRQVGSLAGTTCRKKGYVLIVICGVAHRAHRLAWLYVHGVWPREQIDHINGNRQDNRIANLMDVSGSVNQCNSRYDGTRGIGVRGVDYYKSKWRAMGSRMSRRVYLGMFETKEEAELARKNFEMSRYGELACRDGNRPKY